MENEFIDEERLPFIERYDDNNDSIYQDDEQETSFSQQEDTNMRDLNVQINALERGFNVEIPPEERARFRLSSGYFQIEKFPH